MKLNNVAVDIMLAQRGWSCADFAIALGISSAALTAMRKQQRIRPMTVNRVATILGVDARIVVEGGESVPPATTQAVNDGVIAADYGPRPKPERAPKPPKAPQAPKEPPPAWRTDYGAYKSEVLTAYEAHVADAAWLAERQEYHPNLDILLSLKKAFFDFWGTEAGWEHKKRGRGIRVINWRNTFNNALSLKSNQVWKPRASAEPECDERGYDKWGRLVDEDKRRAWANRITGQEGA